MRTFSDLEKQRRIEVTVDKYIFVCRRPTAADFARMAMTNQHEPFEFARRFVVDWRNVSERDVFGDGSEESIAFDLALWQAWCDDSPEFWGPLANTLLDAYRAHKGMVDDAVGEPEAG
jgi:hypothetical protein